MKNYIPYEKKLQFNTDNTIFVSSYFQDSLLLKGNILLTTNNPNGSKFIGKMNADGIFEWAIADEGGHQIYRANDNEFFVSGYVNTSVTLGKGAKQVTLYEQDGYRYVAKYIKTGELIWAKQLNKNSAETIDNVGNIYVLEFIPNLPVFTLQKYNSNGIFDKTITRSEFKDIYKIQIAADKKGNIFYSGGFLESMTIEDTTIYGSPNYYQFFLAKFDSIGQLKWITTSAGTGGAGAKAISLGDDNSIYITGDMQGEVTFGNNTVNEPNGGIFTLKITDNDVSAISVKDFPNPSTVFNISPNPTSGIFQVNYSSTETGNLQLNITDGKGKIVYTEAFYGDYNKSIDLGTKAKGVYFVEVISDGKKRSVKKIVLE